MKVYLVGGAVRNKLLGWPVKENDWVVVGSTPEEMISKGFRPVGKDFPVFLHPKTQEEYALARTERKTAKGYHGFEFYAAPDVSLEEDLRRRDLTINAIAEAEDGTLIDPFNGQADIQAKIFRHVSSSFEEDPVRLLRVCRFSATFEDFGLAPETLKLLQTMVSKGEIDALVPERVWKELQGALKQTRPQRFFHVLDKSRAFSCVLEEVGDISILKPLDVATGLSPNPTVRFAAAFGQLELKKLEALCNRMRIPNEYADLAKLTARYYSACEQVDATTPEAALGLLEKLDPFRRPERFEQFLVACQAIYNTKNPKHTFKQIKQLQQAFTACSKLDISAVDKALPGIEIAKNIRQLRLNALKKK